MKYTYLFYYIGLIIIILLFSYHNSLQTETYTREEFTPHLRRIYRPHLRNARLFTEGTYHSAREHFQRFMRKIGVSK